MGIFLPGPSTTEHENSSIKAPTVQKSLSKASKVHENLSNEPLGFDPVTREHVFRDGIRPGSRIYVYKSPGGTDARLYVVDTVNPDGTICTYSLAEYISRKESVGTSSFFIESKYAVEDIQKITTASIKKDSTILLLEKVIPFLKYFSKRDATSSELNILSESFDKLKECTVSYDSYLLTVNCLSKALEIFNSF
jgi:hypothetical protein